MHPSALCSNTSLRKLLLARILQPISQVKGIVHLKFLENIQAAIEANLPARIADDVATPSPT